MPELDDKDEFMSWQELLRQSIEEARNRPMPLHEAVAKACKEPTLEAALAWIAVWETDRVVKQALRNTESNERTPEGGLYETCFGVCFRAVLKAYPSRTTPEANFHGTRA